MNFIKEKFMHYWTDHKVEMAVIVIIIVACLLGM